MCSAFSKPFEEHPVITPSTSWYVPLSFCRRLLAEGQLGSAESNPSLQVKVLAALIKVLEDQLHSAICEIKRLEDTLHHICGVSRKSAFGKPMGLIELLDLIERLVMTLHAHLVAGTRVMLLL